MSTCTNLAFIVIQHLSPDYKSLMSELVAKITDIPVHVAEDNMQVEADNIYLIPPRKNLKIFHGRLLLTDQDRSPNTVNLPIDVFFTSLAEDKAANAVGIILSGTGSDGTRGCRAIKEVGGMVMVQAEQTAKFDGMPKSVIANGLPDFILPVEDMPEQLLSFVKHPYTARIQDKLPISEEKGVLPKIFALLREKSKIDFTFYKPSTIIRRIERRMTVNHVDNMEHYVSYLAANPHEQNILFRELLIGVTSFFRDKEVFDVLKQNYLRELLEQANKSEFRVWIAGCSTGEEAYSYGILCLEILEKLNKKINIKIFATDIDNNAISKAGAGDFPESITADIPPEYLSKYFLHRGESYQVCRQLREIVVFAQHNIIKDPPFTNIDVISCRNLLIYLQQVLQEKVFNSFNFSLNKGGLLVLGTSESIGNAVNLFEIVHSKHKIFKGLGQHSSLDFGRFEAPSQANLQPSFLSRPASITSFLNTDEGVILKSFVNTVACDYIHCALIIDEDMNLLHVIGDAKRYVLPFSGKVTTEVTKNINKALLIPISTGVTKVLKTGEDLYFSNIKLDHELFGGFRVDLRIKTLPVKKGRPQLVAVVINDLNQHEEKSNVKTINYDVSKEYEQRIMDLEQELQFNRENLQASIEELETSNEELQATNEELLASNEELQSTNEELQSVNEELFTVNSEYQNKIVELTELNNDMDNFMNNADVIALFLDENLDIRKFTNNASLIFNVRSTDIGRPFVELSDHLVNFDLKSLVKNDHNLNKPHKYEVQDDRGNWYYLRIMPYMISSNVRSGAVVILNEINMLKQVKQELSVEYERQSLVFQKLGIGTWEWDIANDRLSLSAQAKTIFGQNALDFPSNFAGFIALIHPEDRHRVEQTIKLSLASDTPYDTVHRIVRSDGLVRQVEEIGHLLRNGNGEPLQMIGIVRDISEQKK